MNAEPEKTDCEKAYIREWVDIVKQATVEGDTVLRGDELFNYCCRLSADQFADLRRHVLRTLSFLSEVSDLLPRNPQIR